MKKLCKALALTLCTVMLLSTLTVVGDPGGKTVLTLEEAKRIALDNDVQFKLQQSYIQQKSDDYEEVYDDNSKSDNTSYKSVSDRAAAEVGRKMAIENAAFAVRQEVFTRNDLKRLSDYNVTTSYYGVMKANYTLDDKKRAIDTAKKNLDVAKIKFEQGLITKNGLSQIENAYTASQTEYNKAFSELQNSMSTLSRNIGKTLDVFNTEIDMTINTPDVKSLDLNKIKEDYIKNSEGLYLLKESLEIAEYKQDLTQEKYDYYYKRNPSKTRLIIKDLNDLLEKANRDYDKAKYKFDEAEKELDVTLNSLYTGINTTLEAIESLQKNVDDTKTTVEQDKIRLELGLISKIAFDNSESDLRDLENKLNTTMISLNDQYLALTQYSYLQEK
ncbi:MAG TPA: TolC family protein [Clostridia bacterium]|nr:TolC family protein [Clostridia bacterium]